MPLMSGPTLTPWPDPQPPTEEALEAHAAFGELGVMNAKRFLTERRP